MLDKSNWVDVIIRQGDGFTVTQRIALVMQSPRSFQIDPSAGNVIGYHVICDAHRYQIEIDARYAERIRDTSFCPYCRLNQPAVDTSDQIVEILRRRIVSSELRHRTNDFIESLDI